MKVYNLESSRSSRPVANQFVIEEKGGILGNFIMRQTFQSYDSVIAVVTRWRYCDVVRHNGKEKEVELDETYWNYSRTTSKYRNIFLGESTKETEQKIKSGEYKLINLNK